MSVEANITLVQKLGQSMAEGDWETFFSCYADDVVWSVGGGPEESLIPFFGTYRGIDEIRQCVQVAADQPLQPTDYVVTDVYGSEDRVFAVGHSSYRMEPTGHEFTTPHIIAFRLRDGKIVEQQRLMDTAKFHIAYAEYLAGEH